MALTSNWHKVQQRFGQCGGLAMPKISGFWCEIDHIEKSGPPLVLLHGSGQDETCWGDNVAKIAPTSPIVRVRGNIVWEGKYAFFRRRPDRSLDMPDLTRSATEISFLIETVTQQFGGRRPILLGYSNGAIVAAAAIRDHAPTIEGAILLRGLSPDPDTPFLQTITCPVLILSGETDSRRHPQDGTRLAAQLTAAGADTAYHLLPCGHGWDPEGQDGMIIKDWLAKLGTAGRSTA
ncbi:hypothetical protein FS764_16970 [Agrobacterium vitis]|nr:hypothetical protein [Agrobacterium vitis]